jgi:hypothetical protein
MLRKSANDSLDFTNGQIEYSYQIDSVGQVELSKKDTRALYEAMKKYYGDLENDQRNRLLTLATKHCPRDHHDWQEILRIAGDA